MTFSSSPLWGKNSENASSLPQPAAEMLQYMREEEKMAHDVYWTMYDLWRAVIFANIALGTTTH
jgi:hypothetical protein